jgi:hypothetical protein
MSIEEFLSKTDDEQDIYFLNKFKTELKTYNLDLDAIKPGSFICGSTVVNTLLYSKGFNTKDLDIFCVPDNVIPLINKIISRGYDLIGIYDRDCTFTDNSVKDQTNGYEYIKQDHEHNHFLKVYKFKKNDTKANTEVLYGSITVKHNHDKYIDVVVINVTNKDDINSAIEKCFDSFDMDICQNRFDGTKFIIKNREYAIRGITNFNPAICKNERNFKRIKKYLGRDIEIKGNVFEDQLEDQDQVRVDQVEDQVVLVDRITSAIYKTLSYLY